MENIPKKRITEIIFLISGIFALLFFLRNYFFFLEELAELSGLITIEETVRNILFKDEKFNFLPSLLLIINPILCIIFLSLWLGSVYSLIKDPFDNVTKRHYLFLILLIVFYLISFHISGLFFLDHLSGKDYFSF